ncbi:DEAD/DEAH box helicase [Streptomyces longispororuber]|uniref:DEAD/DEAH box helicase n=1 Tax=Streptomyces longispororuber TaxID=68230 RepID=UPI00210EAD97|nr:DEAD/DEAH box helicase [Streptomyces longispororuber]MCQ4207476.1 Helicase associated domain protein [Streptomyces longispororuber]
MAEQVLRPHQVEAVDAILRSLQAPADGRLPADGLRTQCIAATGSGKTLVAGAAARRLGARRVLVLVPTLDLLVQTATAWRRDGGRTGAMVGVCSLRAEESEGVPCSTDPEELVEWLRDLDTVTVFATYASVGQGVLQRAHLAGLAAWDLMVVDEAHRTSGDGLKPWAAVHDQQVLPAARRLYMTATPRVWEAADGRRAPRLVASMSEDSPVFGPVAYRLSLSEAVSRGLVAPYQVVCVDIRDPEHGRRAEGGTGVEEVRGARLAALQTGVLTAAAQENLRRLLTFHTRVAEAEAMAEGIGDVAARLWKRDPAVYPHPERVWASWLYGGHPPVHRRAVLDAFASDVIEPGSEEGGAPGPVPAALRLLSSVKVLGEGVDTANCDSVAFCDVRGSMVDIVQMVGRALRVRPGDGKLASLVVPVFLGRDEDPDDMLTSPAYGALAKVLEALRAHDAETIEALADSRPRSGPDRAVEPQPEEKEEGDDGGPVTVMSAPARELLKFSAPRDPAQLARFMRLRVIQPEGAYWRRGIEACARYAKETGTGQLRVPYDFVTPDDWSPAGFPLGTWLADQRRHHKAGRLDAGRVAELNAQGMVWSHHDVSFDEGLTAARSWAAEHGHFLPPAAAVWNGYPVGTWAKNQRAAAKATGAGAAALTPARREALEDVDPGWCPVWDVGWQRAFRLLQAHVRAGGGVPGAAGELVVQGEDLGRWVRAQRLALDQLLPAQRWLLVHAVGLAPAAADERPDRLTQDDKWALNVRAARRFHAREGHLNVPRKHTEVLEGAGDDATEVKLGMWIANARRRAEKLTPGRRADLDEIGMRW